MSIYTNRILNMKHIKVIGFDMDHTLVRYNTELFEELTFHESIKKLIEDKGYPEEIKNLSFEFSKAIRGLIVDKDNGNILKVSLHNKIKNAYHGTKKINYKDVKKFYRGSSVDVSDSQYVSVDTAFSIAYTVLYMKLVDLRDKQELVYPSYREIAEDISYAVDMAHRDGTLKSTVKKDLKKYVQIDETIVDALERLAAYGKKIWVITNSDFDYTKALLDYTITPYLKNHKHWSELFEITITLAAKPKFFTDNTPLLEVDLKKGALYNYDKKMIPGVYQGGSADKLQKDFELTGDEILYFGDHIYGDVVKLKKACEWRTALIVEELADEVSAHKKAKTLSKKIDELMSIKIGIEKELDELYTKEHELNQPIKKEDVSGKFSEIEKIDKEIGKHIKEYESYFNSSWGEVMRAGIEPSFFAYQIERYACIYTDRISNLIDYSPRHYFRPKKRKMAHELG